MDPDYDRILLEIAGEVRPLLLPGKPADYIPALARVPADRFGMAVRTLDGRIHTVRDSDEPFSIQSVSKVFTFILAAAVWSPGLNERGKSLAGTQALELFTSKTGMSIF